MLKAIDLAKVTLEEAYRQTVAQLTAAGIDHAQEDARHLVSGVFGLSLTALVTDGRRVLDLQEQARLAQAVERRKAREPVYRILGTREFYGLDFRLSDATLEPRADTEFLVETCLPYLRAAVARQGTARFVDMGTGTGAVAIALLKNCAKTSGLATDIADGALETAAANALLNGVGDRLETAKSAWFAAIGERFDMIVSNPPYIATDQIGTLEPEVRDFDPMLALDGGPDGLDAYRSIAEGADRHLVADGVVALEIGFDQKQSVTSIFCDAGFERIEAVKDLGGNDRVLVFGRLP